jgi:hypothetical protein
MNYHSIVAEEDDGEKCLIQVIGQQQWTLQLKTSSKSLSAKDKESIRNTKKESLIMFHHGWGTGIRNHYGLWRGNNLLFKDVCGKEECNPYHASMLIIEKVWELLQKHE